MSIRRFVLSLTAGLLSLGTFGCLMAHPDVGDGAGAGGTAGDDTGAGGSSGGAPDGCAQVGAGRIEVDIQGLPGGVDANLILAGPLGSRAITSSEVLEGTPGGPHQLLVTRVTEPDPIVRSVYEYRGAETEFCLEDGETLSIGVDYALVPTSQRLWTNNSNGAGNLLGFSGETLGATASAEPDVSAVAGAGRDVTFDADGNLWSMGATVADPHLMRFDRTDLGASGEKTPQLSIDIAGVKCLPAMRALSFDREGSLWVSTCGGRIVKLTEADLATSGEVTPSVAIAGLTDNGDVAFDMLANLWATDADRIVRYDAGRLAASSEAPADLSMTVRSSEGGPDVAPSNLAFDTAGNLWVIDFGGNLLAKVEVADLAGTGEIDVVARATLALSVSALLERPAFDESGGLWLALDQNRFGRLAPEQLTLSTTAGAPTTPETIITSPSMGYANRMAFYPAPTDLPLYHRWR